MATNGIVSQFSGGSADDESTFKILLASDIHLGYCDNNPAREDDSFKSFEEILRIGRDEEVDFVLLGGDLFHENKPKPTTLHRTLELLRKYCLGPKPVSFEYLGDPEVDFPNQGQPEVNYMNPNINIAMPIFTIHGNHDDPIGSRKTSAVDHLVAAKLVNHFGQWNDLNNIEIRAVPFRKGSTKLALYGLGNVKDNRLFCLIRDHHVQYFLPVESQDDWFNIFVLHQNRVAHGPKSYIPENFIPSFMNLVLWGHEHECRIDPEPTTADCDTYIIQPGSPVATSLCQGEAREKFVGILHVQGRKFRLEKRKLRTVRPLLLTDVVIPEVLPTISKEKDPSAKVEKYVQTKIEMMLREADDMLTGHEDQPIIPLIRVRVFHQNGNETFNPIRFAQKYSDRIANEDIVMFKKISGKRNEKGELDVEDIGDLYQHHDDGDLEGHVETIVEQFFINARLNEDHKNILEVLSERGISEAVKFCVEKDDKDAVPLVIETQMESVINYLIGKNVDEDNIEEVLEDLRNKRLTMPDTAMDEAHQVLANRPVVRRQQIDGSEDDDEEDRNPSTADDPDEDNEDEEPSFSNARGAGRGRRRAGGQGGTRGRGRGRGRGKSSPEADEDSTPPSRGRGRGRASRGANASTSRNSSPPPSVRQTKKTLVQSTLQLRKSPRKANKAAMMFDITDSD